jgi:hypothetical protein
MYTQEIEDCHRRIALGNSLTTLLNYNPDFKAVITQGLLHDEVLKKSLGIVANEREATEFLKAVVVLRTYLDKVLADGEQAQMDLMNYMNLIQDGR